MNQEQIIHRKRSWVGTIITLVILFLLGLFVSRVVFYTHMIRNSGTDLSTLSFNQTVSTITRLALEPVSDQTTDVVVKNRPTLGIEGSPITIVEFGDFECPYSRASSFVIRSLAAKYPKQVTFIYRDFPITEIHPFSQKASEAAQCAFEQGKFWEYHDKLFQNQGDVDDASFVLFANQLNLDTQKFQSCFTSHKYAKQIEEDYQAGIDAGVRGTPTFFMNGNRIPGSIPQDVLEQVIISLGSQKK